MTPQDFQNWLEALPVGISMGVLAWILFSYQPDHTPTRPPTTMPTDQQLTIATLAAAAQIRARLNAIGIHTPNWFAEEAAAVIAAEIRKAKAPTPA